MINKDQLNFAIEIFNAADVDKDDKLNMSELTRAFSLMHIIVKPHEVKRIMKNFGGRDSRKVFFHQYLRMVDSAHSSELMSKCFCEADLEKKGLVSKSQVHAILEKLGHNFSSDVTTNIMKRFHCAQEADGVDFETFFLFTSEAVLFLHGKARPKERPVQPRAYVESKDTFTYGGCFFFFLGQQLF